MYALVLAQPKKIRRKIERQLEDWDFYRAVRTIRPWTGAAVLGDAAKVARARLSVVEAHTALNQAPDSDR